MHSEIGATGMAQRGKVRDDNVLGQRTQLAYVNTIASQADIVWQGYLIERARHAERFVELEGGPRPPRPLRRLRDGPRLAALARAPLPDDVNVLEACREG